MGGNTEQDPDLTGDADTYNDSDTDGDINSASDSFCISNPACFGSEETEIIVKNIPDAENSLFTDDGRLFISAAGTLFEIQKTPDGLFVDLLH